MSQSVPQMTTPGYAGQQGRAPQKFGMATEKEYNQFRQCVADAKNNNEVIDNSQQYQATIDNYTNKSLERVDTLTIGAKAREPFVFENPTTKETTVTSVSVGGRETDSIVVTEEKFVADAGGNIIIHEYRSAQHLRSNSEDKIWKTKGEISETSIDFNGDGWADERLYHEGPDQQGASWDTHSIDTNKDGKIDFYVRKRSSISIPESNQVEATVTQVETTTTQQNPGGIITSASLKLEEYKDGRLETTFPAMESKMGD